MLLLKNAIIVTSEKEEAGSIVIEGGKIIDVLYSGSDTYDYYIYRYMQDADEIRDLEGLHIMAGGIDAHVHFREPGLTHKADMRTESRAAIAGGVTSVIDMPNTIPATTSAATLKAKIQAASPIEDAKISFHIGATNENIDDICRLVMHGDEETGLKP